MKYFILVILLLYNFKYFAQKVSHNDTVISLQKLNADQSTRKLKCHREPCDTLELYQNKMGVSKRVYQHYLHTSDQGTFTYISSNESTQDSLLIYAKKHNHYFFYNRRGDVVWSGKSFYSSSEIGGEKLIYWRNGRVKLVEFYDNKSSWHEMPGPEGIWQWYRKDGTLKKVVIYVYGPDANSDFRTKRTIKINRKGNITKDKTLFQPMNKKPYKT